MTQAQLQAASDDNITDTTIIIPSAHRTANNAMIDEIYPDVVNDTQSTTNILTKVDTDFNYDFNITKVGRMVYIEGTIRNATFSPVTAQNIATGLSGQYAPARDTYVDCFDAAGNRMRLNFDADGTLKLVNTVSTQNDFTVNAHYATAS
jgi:hypothetical protein